MELGRSDVKKLVEDTVRIFPREECRTCDRLHRFPKQLDVQPSEVMI
jgi:hypothetical protein